MTTQFLNNAAAAQDAGRDDALSAARWALDVEDDTERRRLFDGHRARRVPITRDGFPATDFTAADAWLINERRTAAAAGITFPDHLTPISARMAAASLEIDGRPDIAAAAAVGGHVSEFTYAGRGGRYVPVSGPAIRRQEIADAIGAAIAAAGMAVTIATLRTAAGA